MARRGELLTAIEKARVVFHLESPRLGRERFMWPACFQGDATGEDNPRAFVWSKTGPRGQETLRMFDDGTLAFERRQPSPKPNEIVTVGFDPLTDDTMGFIRLCATTYSHASRLAGTVAAPFRVEVTLELPHGRDAVALFRRDSHVQPIDFMRTARMKKPVARTEATVAVVAAIQPIPVADALVRLLGGVADEFDLDSDGVSASARVLGLKEAPLRQLVAERLPAGA